MFNKKQSIRISKLLLGITVVTLSSVVLVITVYQVIKQQLLYSKAATTTSPEPYWEDQFTTQSSRWDWQYSRGAGYHRLTSTSEAQSAVELGVTSSAASNAYSDSSLHERSHQYTMGALEMRSRTTDRNTGPGDGQGTRGWGFWDGDVNYQQSSAVWFWSASPESSDILSGFRVQVFSNGTFYLNQRIDSIDMTQWHTYRIEMLPGLVKFLVDGELIAQTNNLPSDHFRVEIWLDNYAINLTPGGYNRSYIDLTGNQRMYVDWVRYYQAVEEVTPTPTPSPISTPGDANGDDKVDSADYVIWLNHYGTNTQNGSQDGDFNNNGKVDGIDCVIWLNNYSA